MTKGTVIQNATVGGGTDNETGRGFMTSSPTIQIIGV